jgi:hypothetical protein
MALGEPGAGAIAGGSLVGLVIIVLNAKAFF